MTLRLCLMTLLCVFAVGTAEAAYKARVVVPAGPFFKTTDPTFGPAGYQTLARDYGADAIAKHLVAPGGIAVSGPTTAPRAYVADMFTLREIDLMAGTIKNMLPVSGEGISPSNVTTGRIDGRDVLVVSGWPSGRVLVLETATGAVLKDESGFAAPHDALILDDGALIVTETDAGQLTHVSHDGTRTVLAAGFQRPVGLARSEAGVLYVTDAKAGTITAMTLTTGTQRTVATGLAGPEGIALLPTGALAVMNTGRSAILQIDPETGEQERIATNVAVGLIPSGLLPTDPQKAAAAGTKVFNGIAVGPNEAIYVPSDIQTALFVLKPGGGPKSFMDMLRGLTSGLFR